MVPLLGKKAKRVFNRCPQCKAGGLKENCTVCGGRGELRAHDSLTLYWGKRLDIWHVALHHAVMRGRRLWILLLIVLSITGKVFLTSYIISAYTEALLPIKDLWYGSQDYKILLGWLSFALDSYIIFFLTTTIENRYTLTKLKHKLSKQNKQTLVNIADYTTEPTMIAIENAWRLADRYDQHSLLPFHVFTSLLDTLSIKTLFARIGLSYDVISKKLAGQFSQNKTTKKEAVALSLPLREIFTEGFINSYDKGKEHLDETSLLLAIATHDPLTRDILYDLAVDRDKLENVVHWVDTRLSFVSRFRQFKKRAHFKPKGVMDRAMTALATPFLDRYSTDLTRLARLGYLELTVGRTKEYARLFRTIEGGGASAVLVGPQGVGKTAIIYGLAYLMAEERVPTALQDKRLINLDAARVVSGATASVAAERLITIADEIARAGNIVLVIENIHTLIGISTGAHDSMDLVDVLGSIIARRHFPVIATSEPPDYGGSSVQSTLGQVFKVISIDEPQKNLAIRILEAKTLSLEYKHKVFFSYDAIAELIKLSFRYLPDEYMPAKAISMLEDIAAYKASESAAKDKTVRVSDVAKIVSEKINIPVSQVTQKESEILLNMERLIHEQLIDQEPAVDAVAEALRRARAEMVSGKRPIANFLFLGPTGVGKTQLAKTVADIYFGSAENMVRLDMSEYQNVASVAKLIGAAGKSGNLTRAIKANPFSILLLDELEKAHADILNLFLQVMDDGRLTDGTGRVIDFTHVIIIATSNAGSQFIQDRIRGDVPIKRIADDLISGELKKFFKPEFLNRFDGVIVFKPLSQNEVVDVARLMLNDIENNLEEKKGIKLIIDEDALHGLAEAGYEPEFGARPMRRVIQERIDNPLATLVLQSKVKRRDTVRYTKKGLQIIKAKEL